MQQTQKGYQWSFHVTVHRWNVDFAFNKGNVLRKGRECAPVSFYNPKSGVLTTCLIFVCKLVLVRRRFDIALMQQLQILPMRR